METPDIRNITTTLAPEAATPGNFIRSIIEDDLKKGRHETVVTRFPPEPNGYLHIGHAKSICLNFGLARDFGGRCHLRFDDTNPTKEEVEYTESIKENVRWLGFDWGEHLHYASDYFEQLYQWAELLISQGDAYVEDLSAEEIRAHRGTLTEPGKESPFRGRSSEENLDLFRRMRAGEFADGAKVLRARIDMASPNMNLRDPVMYRILHAPHPTPAINGASIPCMISPTARATPSKESPTPFALWNSPITAHSMNGFCNGWGSTSRINTSLPD